MKIVDYKDEKVIWLTYEEEQNLAQSVMDALSGFKARYGFFDLLKEIYYRKCLNGWIITAAELEQLCEYYEYYDIEIPKLKLDENYMKVPRVLNGKERSQQDYVREIKDLVIRAWKEIWEEHRAIQISAREFEKFPIHRKTKDFSEDYIKEELIKEKLFWEEIVKKAKEFKMTKKQVFPLVSDYMKRGDPNVITLKNKNLNNETKIH